VHLFEGASSDENNKCEVSMNPPKTFAYLSGGIRALKLVLA